MHVPFNNLKLSTNQVSQAYLTQVKKLLSQSNFILTQQVEDFEKQWAKMIGTKYCIGVSCGADAIYLSLKALGIGPGDEVIIQANAYNASLTPILRAGATPRFIDINQDTLTLDTTKLAKLINKQTKAILPVHLYGQPNHMQAILAIAKKYKLFAIEDCAQAHLAKFKHKRVGNWGHIGAFSFYPTKNLGAFGDAGAVVTNFKKIRDKIIALRNLGQTAKDNHQYLGYNMRLDPIQAIALSLKLKYLRNNTKLRQQAAAYYDKLINQANLPLQPIQKTQQGINVYHLYPVLSLKYDRDKLRQQLAKLGVQTAIHYPVPVYKQTFFKGKVGSYPVTNKVCGQIISLPLFIGITKKQQTYVVESLKKILNS